MLKIDRNKPPKEFLKIVERPKERLFEWARRPLEERQQRRAPFSSDIFHRKDIRKHIAKEFNHKCAYCECRLGLNGDLDHFRPKSLYPWLAFEWDNIFYACSTCNYRKGNSFPLAGERAPFLATMDEVISNEKRLLVDPTQEHPGQHLVFLTEGIILPRNKSKLGLSTIKTFGLNRDELVFGRHRDTGEALGVWLHAINSQQDIPKNFLLEAEFLACQHWAIAKSIESQHKLPASKVTGKNLRRLLSQLLRNSDRDFRELLHHEVKLFGAEGSKLKEYWKIRQTDGELVLDNDLDVRSSSVEISLGDKAIETAPRSRGHVSKICIRNFKAIDEIVIKTPTRRHEKAGAPCLLLLGENAVGKSSFLQGVGLALLGTEEIERLGLSYSDFARSIGKDSWDQWGKDRIEVTVNFEHKNQSAVFSYDPFPHELGGTPHQSALVLGYGPYRYFSPQKTTRGKNPSDRIKSLFDPSKPLANPTRWLGQLSGSKFNTVAQTIRTILPIGDDDELFVDPEFGICVRADGQVSPITKLSEGYRSIFAMVADICRTLLDHWPRLEDAHAIVLIDEIDTHLHPRWKLKVMASLRKALPKVQFIVTSHDPLCIRGMDDEEVVVLYRDAVGRVSQLEDLPKVSGMRAEQLLTSEYFGLQSTLEPELHLDVARLSDELDEGTSHSLGIEAGKLISRLTIGDSATAQIIQEALLKYLREREKPIGGLSKNARAEAVLAVAKALRNTRGNS